jgi:prevent-host-death family protein
MFMATSVEPKLSVPGYEKTIGAGEFKAKCLKLLDEVAETGESLIVTKFGKPVAKIVPMPVKRVPLRGALQGSVLWEGDIISPLEDEWEANR